MALDDTTFANCTDKMTVLWPHSAEKASSSESAQPASRAQHDDFHLLPSLVCGLSLPPFHKRGLGCTQRSSLQGTSKRPSRAEVFQVFALHASRLASAMTLSAA
eukprot:3112482-Amphidinium_carterae.1